MKKHKKEMKKESPKAKPPEPTVAAPRPPTPGTVIERVYKKKTYTVQVLDRGFKFDDREWGSLTAIAKEITGAASISGPRFFGLAKPAAGGEAKAR